MCQSLINICDDIIISKAALYSNTGQCSCPNSDFGLFQKHDSTHVHKQSIVLVQTTAVLLFWNRTLPLLAQSTTLWWFKSRHCSCRGKADTRNEERFELFRQPKLPAKLAGFNKIERLRFGTSQIEGSVSKQGLSKQGLAQVGLWWQTQSSKPSFLNWFSA